MEENEIMNYRLLSYQRDGFIKADEIRKNHRVVSSVQPTGSGKSFLAMTQMLQINNPNYLGIDGEILNFKIDENGVINDSKILYIAPTNEIGVQIKLDIVKYILKEDTTNLSTKQIDELVRKAFPNLEFLCYQTLASEKINLESETADLVILDEVHRSGAKTFQENVAELLGCKIDKDGEVVYNPESGKDNMQIFTTSATPERDVDGKDMTKVWAKVLGGYTEEDLSDNVRADLCINMSLPEAVKNDYISIPEVTHFNPNLVDTKEYKSLINSIDGNKIKNVANKKRIEEKIRDIEETVIGIPRYHKIMKAIENYKSEIPEELEEYKEDIEEIRKNIQSEIRKIPDYDSMTLEERKRIKSKITEKFQEQEKEKLKKQANIRVMAQSMKDGKFNFHGKYILFVPHNISKNGKEKADTKTYLENQAKEMQEMILEAAKLAEISLNERDFDWTYLSGEFDKKDNAKNLKEFNDKSTTEGKLSFIVASDKLNEGIHLDGISGSFMTRNICETENTPKRAQSILFLQQLGRTVSAKVPGKTDEPRMIFDFVNNFYTQNINGCVDEEQMIDLFKLTEEQQKLVDAYNLSKEYLPESKEIKTAKLFEIFDIVLSYYKDAKSISDIVPSRAKTIDDLLKQEPFSKVINAKLGKDTIFDKAKEDFWKNEKYMEDYTLEDLKKYGMLDNLACIKKIEEYIDEEGFIIGGVSEKFIGYNIHTATLYSKDGKDIEGFFEGQFDPETGKDVNGFYRSGFNDDGIHRETGTIHDEHGFMADGKNILTGTYVDLAGYNIYGYKPEYNRDDRYNPIRDEEIGGWDRKGQFHEKTEDGTYLKRGESSAKVKIGDEEKSIDRHGFWGRGNNIGNINNKSYKEKLIVDVTLPDNCTFGTAYFDKSGICTNVKEGMYKDARAQRYAIILTQDEQEIYFDIDKNDRDGFSVENYGHKDTGTRFDLNGRTADFYNYKDEKTRNFIVSFPKSLPSYLLEQFDFNKNGLNKTTGSYRDIFGFTVLEYLSSGLPQLKDYTTNDYGFSISEIPKGFIGTNFKPFYNKKSGKNILGTDEDGNINGKLHNSFNVTHDFFEKCIRGETDLKLYTENYAKEKKLLVSEAECEINTSIKQAMILYRICPYLQRNKEFKTKDLGKDFEDVYKLSGDKLQILLDKCPELQTYVIEDEKGYSNLIGSIDKKINANSKNVNLQEKKDKLKELYARNLRLKEQIELLDKE